MFFLYTSYERVAIKILKTPPLTIVHKNMKHLGVNLTKHVQVLCAENHQMFMKEIKEDGNTGRNIARSWIGWLSTEKMSILPELIYGFNPTPIKLEQDFCS